MGNNKGMDADSFDNSAPNLSRKEKSKQKKK